MKQTALFGALICVSLIFDYPVSAQNTVSSEITIFDLKANPVTELPSSLEHILPHKERSYTNFSIENSDSGPYMRALSSGTSSWLEYDLGDVDPELYPVMEWQWMVNQFPKTEWEAKKSNDDYAIRIELVYDFKGSAKNILNIVKKGLFTSLFRKYPPEFVISYVWSLNVPAEESFVSPSAKNTLILPIESDVAMMGRWVSEHRNVLNDLQKHWSGSTKLYLKKIRIKADTESVPTVSESGLKYIRLIAGETASQ